MPSNLEEKLSFSFPDGTEDLSIVDLFYFFTDFKEVSNKLIRLLKRANATVCSANGREFACTKRQIEVLFFMGILFLPAYRDYIFIEF